MSDALHRLERGSTLLLIVDMQERLLPAVEGAPGVTRATRLLLRAAELLEIPVIATTQYAKGLGPIVAPIRELLPAATSGLDKTAFSCFDDPGFAPLLSALGEAPTLLVTGIETHICVAGTVLGARRLGLSVQVVVDACAARSCGSHELGLKRMEQAGALLTSAEMAVYELVGSSATQEFRALLPYFKDAE